MIKPKFFDYIFFIITLLVITIFSVYAYGRQGSEAAVYIQSQDEEWVFPLDEKREIDVQGPIGITEVHIEAGHAYVHSSPCNEQICVTSGRISRPGTWIACLPNLVFIKIEGIDEEEIDAGSF
jgi:hypothetical protein